jgi:hypothetical protein
MRSRSLFAPHKSSWGLIRVTLDGDFHRDYGLDSQGRLMCQMPRQKKRLLMKPGKPLSFPMPIHEPELPPPSEVDFLWQHADGPEPMPMDFLMGGPLLGDFALPDPIH